MVLLTSLMYRIFNQKSVIELTLMIELQVVNIILNENKILVGQTENNVVLVYCLQYELIIILFCEVMFVSTNYKAKFIISDIYLSYNLVLKHSSTKSCILYLMIEFIIRAIQKLNKDRKS